MQRTKRKREMLRFWTRRSGRTGRRKVHRQIRDRLFRFLFEKDREALLQLYNALNGTAYRDASKLEIVTIENAVYVVMKNDLAFVMAGTLNLYEHQSTFNPNMPVRFLIYLAEEYQKLVERAETSLYGTKQVILPTPQCIVFYNGEKEMPEEQILSLSDAFENRKSRSDVELKVRMLNINHGNHQGLLEECKVLKEYVEFVETVRIYIAEGLERQQALNMAIDYSVEHDILSEFLRKYRAEVLGMLLEEFDVDKYERTLRAEGREEGRKEGRKEGQEQGRKEGQEQGRGQVLELTRILINQNRLDDLKRMAEEPAYCEKLFREFGL